jgi:hypothetical protein
MCAAFAAAYIALDAVWTVNGLCFATFRIPLHTHFIRA